MVPVTLRSTLLCLSLAGSVGCVPEPASPSRAVWPQLGEPTAGAVDAGRDAPVHVVDAGVSVSPDADGAQDLDASDASEPEERAPYQGPMPSVDRRDAPAREIASLSPRACRDRVRAAKLPAKSAGGAPGVATPMRLDGPLHGVTFRGPGPTSKHSVMDCRLVLALDAFAKVLASHGVTDVHYGNTYRPKARFRGQRGRTASQHAYALAIDIVRFDLRDGTVLRVEEDYHGKPGTPSCGPEAVMTERSPASDLFRNIVCDVARAGVFHHMLTPSYDAAHRTHFHFDIQRDGIWVTVR
jgi:hypothetical protein